MRRQPRVEHNLELTVTSKEFVAEGVVRLTLRRHDGGELPGWKPGAHIDLVIEDDLIRQYSLCGEPADRSEMQVTVLRDPYSRGGSQYVHDELTAGDLVHVRGPRNHFPLVLANRYLFIAGGIGITPIMPMIAEVARSGIEWRLVYGGRTRSSMAFYAELKRQYNGKVTCAPQDEYGLLDLPAMLSKPGATATDFAVYCCGPKTLLSAVEGLCAGWPKGALHVEHFYPVSDDLNCPRDYFEIELARSGVTLGVPENRSILDVVEEAGVSVFHSCRNGVCGTCETPVLSGTPDHRDSILTAEEQASCNTMMICCSRARTPRLVLDL